MDNGTERVRSEKDTESWERKIRLYVAYQDRSTSRFRVLIVSTKSRDHVDYIRESAATLVRNPKRTLLCGVHLNDYLAEPDAVCSTCFRDHRGTTGAGPPGTANRDGRSTTIAVVHRPGLPVGRSRDRAWFPE